MIEPTNGRILWYHPAPDEQITHGTQPLAAIVCHVWYSRMVNLRVFDSNGNGASRTSVMLVQEGDVVPSSSYCTWMPYQVGQAERTRQAEKNAALAAGYGTGGHPG